MPRPYIMQITHEEMKEYAEYFKSMRLSTGLDLQDFAPLVGFCRTSISRWERAVSVPKTDINEIVKRYREAIKQIKLT